MIYAPKRTPPRTVTRLVHTGAIGESTSEAALEDDVAALEDADDGLEDVDAAPEDEELPLEQRKPAYEAIVNRKTHPVATASLVPLLLPA